MRGAHPITCLPFQCPHSPFPSRDLHSHAVASIPDPPFPKLHFRLTHSDTNCLIIESVFYAIRARPTSSPIEPIGSIQTTPFRLKPYGKSIRCYSNRRLGIKPYGSGWCYSNHIFLSRAMRRSESNHPHQYFVSLCIAGTPPSYFCTQLEPRDAGCPLRPANARP